MKHKIITILLLLLSTTLFADQDFGNVDVELLEGEVKTLDIDQLSRIAVGDAKLVQVQMLNNKTILMIGQAKGSTSLKVWKNNGDSESFRIIVKDKSASEDIQMKQIISMKVKIVEFREASLKQIGINWSKASSGPQFLLAKDLISLPSADIIQNLAGDALNMVGSTSQTPLFLGSSIALNSTISFMQSVGHASTLAEPTLSCLSGEEADFLAGGEVPFAVVNGDGQASVTFKPYGIQLKVEPKADRHNRISTLIQTEVSSIDGSVTVAGVPGFITRRTKTHMNVLNGQTIVISGLLSDNNRQDVEYIPGLGNLPIIGQMFQNKNFSREKTQLVIFVTPTIVSPETLDDYNAAKTEHQLSQQELKKWNNMLDKGMAEISINIKG